MERLSRLVVLVSLVGALAAHAFLTSHTSPMPPWAPAAAFAATFVLTWVSLPLAILPPLLLAYAAPAVLMVAFATPSPSHDVSLWLALLAGAIVAASDWSRWHTPPAWTPWIAAWTLVLAVTWPIVAGREIDFSLVAARTLDTPSGLGAGAPAAAAANVTHAALGQIVGLLWLDLLFARFGVSRVGRVERWVFAPLVLGIAAASAAALYQRYRDLEWLSVAPWVELQRAGSLMLDANSFGMAAAIWAPLTIVLAWRLGQPLWLGAALSLLLLAGMWASGSRTALVTAAAGVLALALIIVAAMRSWWARLATIAVVVAAAGLLVASGAAGRQGGANPMTRLLDSVSWYETGGIGRVAQSLRDRDGYGIAARRAIAEHPVTGVGAGAFNHMASDYSYLALGAILQADNAQNWWRQQVAELGYLGAAPAIAMTVIVALLVGRAFVGGDRRPSAVVVAIVLVAVGLVSLVGVKTQHPALWLTLVSIVYWLWALVHRVAEPGAAEGSSRAVWAAVLLLPLLVAAGQGWSAVTDLRVPVRAARIGFPYAYGFSAPDGDNVPWTGAHAVAVLRAEHAWFALTATPARAEGPVRVQLWRGQAPIADVEASSAMPVRRFIAVPAGQRFLMLESRVSAVAPDGRGLRMVGEWVREAPADAAPGTLVP